MAMTSGSLSGGMPTLGLRLDLAVWMVSSGNAPSLVITEAMVHSVILFVLMQAAPCTCPIHTLSAYTTPVYDTHECNQKISHRQNALKAKASGKAYLNGGGFLSGVKYATTHCAIIMVLTRKT